MSNSGFVQILHDLLRHESVISAPPAYRWVLITILDRATYLPCKFDDHGFVIDLLPGQFMCTERKLAEYANVSRNDVQRAIARFVEVEILSQEVRHTKSIFTILWGVKLKTGEPTSEPTVSQDRAIKEEYNTKIQQQPNACVVSSTSKKTKKQALIDDILEKHSVDLDSAFLGSLIRRFSIKTISIAMDEYEQVKIKTNPRGLLTSIAKIHHEEMKENECKLANQ
jgi:DNA-binding transcriptional MocR family regulator